MGDEVMMPFIRDCFSNMRPMGGFHRQAMDYFRQYMIVGGMPQVVKLYVQTRDFQKVDEEKRAILGLYRKDISNYADRQENKVTAIFDEIPGQLQRHERRFRLAALKENARMRDYQDAFFWLSDARIINCCYNTTQPNIGLRLNEERATLKCYMADTGLLISHSFDENGIMKQEIYQKLMMDKLEVNAGMLVENIVAQMLRASGHKLYFYSRNSSENDKRMEIDFLIAKSKITTRHNISPIEVKSSTKYTLTSLNKFITKFANYLSTSYVVHSTDLEVKGNIVYLPLYMVPLL
jgi:predicted AAA+ superfamily ATPase